MTDEETLIGTAARGDLQEVAACLGRGINVNCTDHTGLTPLHAAAAGNGDNVELCEYLIRQGACLDAHNKDGWTPLHFAAASGNRQVAELLLRSGADPNPGLIAMNLPSLVAHMMGHEELATILGEVELRAAQETARARIEEERQQREAEERRRCEDEARQREEEEARKRAEEEARKRAEEETRKRAEEDARKREENEARKREEEEAKQREEEQKRRQAAEAPRAVQQDREAVAPLAQRSARAGETSGQPQGGSAAPGRPAEPMPQAHPTPVPPPPTVPAGSIEVHCSSCGHVFRRPAALIGKLEKCPHCRMVLRVPPPAATA